MARAAALCCRGLNSATDPPVGSALEPFYRSNNAGTAPVALEITRKGHMAGRPERAAWIFAIEFTAESQPLSAFPRLLELATPHDNECLELQYSNVVIRIDIVIKLLTSRCPVY